MGLAELTPLEDIVSLGKDVKRFNKALDVTEEIIENAEEFDDVIEVIEHTDGKLWGTLKKWINRNKDEVVEEVVEGGSDVIKTNRIPDNDSTIGHIFRDAEGHIPDTPENRALLENVANNVDNFRGKDKYGNEWYTMDLEDGSQVWVEVRNGNIFEGGINKAPKPWDPDTGLKKP